MPAWIDRILMFGFQWVATPFLAKAVPWVPKGFWFVVGEGLAHVLAADDKPAAVEALQTKVRECTGVACPPKPVRERIQP